MAVASYESLIRRLEAVTVRLETAALAPAGAAAGAGVAATPASAPAASNAVLAGFDALLDGELAKLSAAARALGGPVEGATELLAKAFKAERAVVATIAACRQPSAPALQKLIAPVGAALTEVGAKTEGRRTDEFNHYKALAEASQALSWVVFIPGSGAPLPGALCDEAWQSAEFWTNKVLMQHRGKEERHCAWAGELKALFNALRAYVKAHHAAGPAWNAMGGEVGDFKLGAAHAQAAAPRAGAPPPPPPPPPPGGPGSLIKEAPAPAKSQSSPNMSALFGQLNRGDGAAQWLRKVSDDMKSKNFADRSGAVPASGAKAGSGAPAHAAAPSAPPKLACEGGRKWVVENQTDARELLIRDVNPKQTVYVYNCRNTVVQIQGKINSLCVDKCTRTSVVFTDIVAACEVVNSSHTELQVTGCVPTIAVDNCTGAQLYLSAASLGCSITTAKSTEVNVLVPGDSAEADMVEAAIPEQFVTTFVHGKWHTQAVEHSAG